MTNKCVLLLIALFATSCASQKGIVYFQPKDQNSDTGSIAIKQTYIAPIQPGDILSVQVFSLSPQANEMFNVFPESTESQYNVNQNSGSTELTPTVGFLVDKDGTITLPLLGKTRVTGLTTKDAADTLSKKLAKYLIQPTVSVRVVNFRISVLGEVSKPSVYTIANGRITLPEALSLAGDLTIYAKRKNVLLIREEDGKREFARIDLTKRDLFNSPYYYLKPNDIIYVQPSRGKVISSGSAFAILPVIISSLTLLVLGYYYIRTSK